jgi:hypothetical protein
MKGELVPGGIKDPSESLLRAFNGSPKCTLSGDIDITYDFDIRYATGGALHINPPSSAFSNHG